MTRVLLYNHSGCENRGCEAIVRSTSALLRAAGVSDIRLCSNQQPYDAGLKLEDVDRVLPSVISPYSMRRLINSVGFRLGMPREHEVARRYAPVIGAGRNSSLCLSVGGDTYCYNPQEHMRVINGRLKRAGVPLVLWGTSVDPERLTEEMVSDLRAYDLIVARESITAAALREKGLRVLRWRDPAFSLQPLTVPLPEGWRGDNTIGLNISPLVLDKMGSREEGIRLFEAFIRHVLETTDACVALFSHVTWAHDDDRTVVNALKAAFSDEERVITLPETLGAREIKGCIARMSLVVTARTHASIAAYSTAVPALVIGYSVKARGIARDLYGREEGHLLESRTLTLPRLEEAFDALIGRKSEERAYLQERLPEYLEDREGAMKAVLALTAGGGQ
ncbi:MAG: polysaccharide pyruvyl transferase family protein [Clostridia bacterium]|nr:polysaccharide pyruvyl transferase family protein [Clostridia bacterium]